LASAVAEIEQFAPVTAVARDAPGTPAGTPQALKAQLLDLLAALNKDNPRILDVYFDDTLKGSYVVDNIYLIRVHQGGNTQLIPDRIVKVCIVR